MSLKSYGSFTIIYLFIQYLIKKNTLIGNVQNIKPAQNCTGFIFCTFHAVIHIYRPFSLCMTVE